MKEYIRFYQARITNYNYYFVEFYKRSNFTIYHRENDKPAIIVEDGRKRWYKHGKYIKEEV